MSLPSVPYPSLSTIQVSTTDDISTLKLALLSLQGIPIAVPFTTFGSPPIPSALPLTAKPALPVLHHPLWENFIEVGNIFTYVNKFLTEDVSSSEMGDHNAVTSVRTLPLPSSSSANRQFSYALQQALHAGIRNELDTYLRDLANIEVEITRSASSASLAAVKNANTSTTAVGTLPTTATGTAPGWSLRRLYVWTVTSVQRLRTLQTLLSHVKGLTGSNILNMIYQDSLQTGDKEARKVYLRILNYLLQPFEKYCFQWLYGLFDDTVFISPVSSPLSDNTNNNNDDNGSFFIAQTVGNITIKDLWLKYTLRLSSVPLFLSTELGTNLYNCGKTLRFIRDACHDEDWVTELANTISAFPGLGKSSSSSSESSSSLSSAISNDGLPYEEFLYTLERNIQLIGPIIDMRLLWLLRERYQLLAHFAAIHRYILLTQGDFAANLVSSLAIELRKPATVINANNRHIMESLLESAVRASNAQLDDRSVLDRVTIRTTVPSSTTTNNNLQGWDIIHLEYSIDEPINSIVNYQAHAILTESFKFLWKIRRCEYELNLAWSDQARLVHDLRKDAFHFVDDIDDTQAPLALLHRGQLLRADIMSFLSTLLAYVMYDVLAPAWTTLHTGVMTAQNMDSLIHTYQNEYLQSISTGLFLAPVTVSSIPLSMNNSTTGHNNLPTDEASLVNLSYSSDASSSQYTEGLEILRETLLTILTYVQQYVDLQRKYCNDLARTMNKLDEQRKKQQQNLTVTESVVPLPTTVTIEDGGQLLAEICLKHAPSLDTLNEQYRNSIQYLVQLVDHLPSKLADKVSSLQNRYDFHGIVRNG